MISLPWSNGEVERVFSQLNIVKNKSRNRLKNETSNAILGIRSGLRRVKKCCHNYELPKDVLQKIGSMATYENPVAEESSTSGIVLDDLYIIVQTTKIN